jgi:ABC-type dipeptide/oligopeptide/nickel transport system permease subunit
MTSRLHGRTGAALAFLAAPSSLYLVALVVVALLAPLIAPVSPTAMSPEHVLQPPSSAHLFGTDQFGRDVLSRTIWGARPTLAVAALSTLLATAVGVPLGLLAGSAGRWTSGPIMRVMDVLLAFPGILLALVVVTVMGSGLSTVVVAVAVSLVPIFARLVYGETTSLVQRQFIHSARIVGVGRARILGRHVLPNLTSQVLVSATTMIGWAILIAASLNFLGFGVHPPSADWGVDLSNGIRYVNTAWWYATFLGLAIAATILAVNRLGDRLAARLDPRQAERATLAPLETAPLVTAPGTPDGAP